MTLVGRVGRVGRITRPADQTVAGHDRVAAGPIAVAHVIGAGNIVVAAIRRASAASARAHVVLGASIAVAARGPIAL